MTQTYDQAPARFARGQFLRLEAHPQHCADADELFEMCRVTRASAPERLLAADLFSGAGGMSLGLEQAGMKVVFGADHDPDALGTHAHHFGGMSVDWDLGDADTVESVGTILRTVGIDVIAGGPPCQPFSKAGRSGMRHLVRRGRRDPHDKRRDLWRSYLEIVEIAHPKAVIMENVPDMALDREMFILRSIVLTLEKLGYSVQERVVNTHRYGVPQFRQRIILVALHRGLEFTWPVESRKRVTLGNAITDLPEIDPSDGWRPDSKYQGWRDYSGPITEYQRQMRAEITGPDSQRVYDHVTRRVRQDDAEAFEHLDTKTAYSELPEHLKRYRDDIFDDKYKRLDADTLSRTITAHIAKDGYWYIHPEQNRTLTIREAARIQTFPDRFRFAGSPTGALRQIGNAVPPRVACAIGQAVIDVLANGAEGFAVQSVTTSAALSSWFQVSGTEARPWLRTGSRWQVVMGESLLGRSSDETIRSVWPHVARWTTPIALLHSAHVLHEMAGWIGRETEALTLQALARALADGSDGELHDDTLDSLVNAKLLTRPVADLAMVVDSEGEEPVVTSAGALRVAGRFFQGTQRWLMNQNSEGRIAVARLIGYEDESRAALLGLMELGTTVCTPKAPDCPACPLRNWCSSAADRLGVEFTGRARWQAPGCGL